MCGNENGQFKAEGSPWSENGIELYDASGARGA